MPVAPYANPVVSQDRAPITLQSGASPQGAFAPDLSPVAKMIEGIYLEEKTKVDDAEGLRADSELLKLESRLKYDDKDGYLTRRGRDAATVVDDTLGSYDTGAGEIAASLTSPEQKSKFQQRSSQRRAMLNDNVQKYSYDEREKYIVEQQEAFIGNEGASAAKAASDMSDDDPTATLLARDAIKASLTRQVDTLAAVASQQGKSVDWFREKSLKVVSDTHAGVLAELMGAEKYALAEQYYTANKGELDGPTAERMAKAIAESNRRGKEQAAFDKIVSTKGSTEDQLKAADAIKDPETRDGVRTRVMQNFREGQALERERNDDTFLAAVNAVEKTGRVGAVNPAVWGTLDLNQRNGLHEMARRMSAEATGAEGEDDTTAWLSIVDYPPKDMAKLTPAQFQGLFKPVLTKQHFEQATKKWENAREAARSPKPGALSQMQTDNDIVQGTFTLGVGKPPTGKDGWSTEEKLEYIRFSEETASRVNEFEAQKGAKATTEEKQKIANSLMAKVYVKRRAGLFSLGEFVGDDNDYTSSGGDRVRRTQITPEQAADAYVPISEIPPNEVEGMTNLLRSYGQAAKGESPTAIRIRLGDRIARAYAARKLGQPPSTIANILKGAPR